MLLTLRHTSCVLVLAGLITGWLGGWDSPALAQNIVEQVIAENTALGAGCNSIGIAVEGPTAPMAPSQEWVEEHMACLGGTVQTAAQCQGALQGDKRLEVCVLIVVQGDPTRTVDCGDVQLFTASGPFGPSEQLTNEAMVMFGDAFAGRDLEGMASSFASCMDAPTMAASTAIIAGFEVDRDEGDVVFRARVGDGPGEQVAFIVTDPRAEVPIAG
jgi:hypothetical protein